jgi:hypothetical protein
MKTNFTDRATIGDLKTTQEGHISTVARAVRTGIQEYTGAELGLIDRDIVRVYRPADEVFSADSLQSFSHATVTINHPPVLVDSENWKEYAAGEVSTAAMKDGEWVALPLMLKDKAAIDAVNSGKVELSAGYTAEIEVVDGVTESGEQYDAIQRNIRINHLALVDKARAGSQARIGDTAENWGAAPLTTKESEMADLKTVVVGDKAVQVAADDADTITQLIADHKAAIDAKDEEIGKLKAECADTAAKVLDAAAIDALVQARVAVIDKARDMVADYDATGKTVENIRRDVVKAIHGDEAAAETVTDAEIKGIFDFATVKPADDKMRKALGDAKAKEDDPWGEIINKKDAK